MDQNINKMVHEESSYANILVIKTSFGSIVFNITIEDTFFNPITTNYIQKHCHSVLEIQYIISGTGVMIADNREYKISPDTLYVIGPHVYHEQKADTEEPIEKFILFLDPKTKCTKENAYLKEEGSVIADSLCNIRFFSHQCTNNLLLTVLFEIHHEIQNQQIGYYSKLQSLFRLLLIHIVREVNSKDKALYKILFGSPEDKKTRIIDRFFRDNYRLNITAGQLAQLLHVSVSQLNRIMKENYNMTFMQKLIETRMESAKCLLKNTCMPIKDISRQIGYNSECNFHYMFRKKYDCSPGEYRKLYSKPEHDE